MATLDSILQEGLLVDRKWLRQRGINATTVDYYLRSNKIDALVHGLYRKPGPPLKWQNMIYSLALLSYTVHVGHMTALEHHGYAHYLKLGVTERIKIFSTQKHPSWMERLEITPGFTIMKRNPFVDSAVGVVEIPFGTWDWPIRYSSP